MELSMDKTELAEHNELLYFVLGLRLRKLGEEKASRIEEIDMAIAEKVVMYIGREWKLRAENLLVQEGQRDSIRGFHNILRALIPGLKAGRPVGDYYRIPAGPLDKARELIIRQVDLMNNNDVSHV